MQVCCSSKGPPALLERHAPSQHAPLRDAAPRQKHAGETSTAAPTQIAFQHRVSREGGKCSLGTGGARSWTLPLVDDGQRRLLLSRVVQCLECGLELLVPLLVGRYALHLFINKCTLLSLPLSLLIHNKFFFPVSSIFSTLGHGDNCCDWDAGLQK